MKQRLHNVAILAMLAVLAVARARGSDAALLLEEPYGKFGFFNPTGHAAIYLSGVCAETPTRLRRCEPGETGVVLSRYHKVGGYDWLAIPLIPYLYAVDDPSQIPESADARMERRLRDNYRREHLMDIVPDDPKREIPGGDWIQLVGESYDRKIYGFSFSTESERDDELIALFNDNRNAMRFNLLFRNCANFSEGVVNFYYPHAVHRSFIADAGLMTPKQVARSLTKYSKKHPDMDLRNFVIPQVPGSIARSTPVNGVVESLVKSKKYVLPLTLLHPAVTGTLIVAYLGDGRFHIDPNAAVFDPLHDVTPIPIQQQTPIQVEADSNGIVPVTAAAFEPVHITGLE
jgi:hypothetical protein